ncbi:metallophosphoesterase [Chlorobium sp. N1]|uniref:metallophosphoesterase family protein n=1 Tax=Chlorobium sp. N1 TaxID=2491138 RepID=UPI0010408E34|nr:metallophosphoesterase [Chlorobium sp. N1]TCD48723.1 metallophosphoesterase [Chlorobium sp. N1]
MEKGTVTIAHISDLHVAGKGDRRQLEDLDSMLGHFTDSGVDHLIISGDLSDRAKEADWEIVRELLLRHGWYDWARTTVIPGNHDLTNLEEEMRFYNALNPLPGARDRACRARAASFSRFFRDLVTGDELRDAGFPFIKVLRFPSLKLAIAGFNSVSAWSPTENPLGSRGEVDPAELRAVRSPEALRAMQGCFVMGLCHHALKVYGTDSLLDQAFDWTMELKNRQEFLAAMRAIGADIVLHGHFHRFQSYVLGGIRFINGGSFRYSPNRYSLLEIDESGAYRHHFAVMP